MENSVQSWHRGLVFCHHLITLFARERNSGENRQTDLFRRLQVDHKLKLRWLLHRQISRFGTFQDLVHVNSRRAGNWSTKSAP